MSLTYLLHIKPELKEAYLKTKSFGKIMMAHDAMMDEFPELKLFLETVLAQDGIDTKHRLWLILYIAIEMEHEKGLSLTLDHLCDLPETMPRIERPKSTEGLDIVTYYIGVLSRIISEAQAKEKAEERLGCPEEGSDDDL